MRSTRRVVPRLLPVILAFGLPLAAHPRAAAAAVLDPDCPVYQGRPVPGDFTGCAELERRVRDTASFTTPHGFRLDRYEAVLDEFFRKLCHRNPETGWVRDKRVRDTGPYLGTLAGGEWTGAAYHGTHQPVVIWYDSTMYEWLKRYRPAGAEETSPEAPPIPDGAVMVKEMFPAPAARCAEYDPETLEPSPEVGLALMIRDNRGARDGWFWGVWWKGAEGSPGFTPDWPAGPETGNRLPFMGFGQYCMNCHASAADNLTFADLKNVQGEPGRPNVYLSQNFLFESALGGQTDAGQHRAAVDTSDDPVRHDHPLAAYDPAFTARFPASDPPAKAEARLLMPSQTYDNVWVPAAGPDAASLLVTSDQCIGCHDAGSTGLQFDMTAPDPAAGRLLNLSPYATWRTSPMGLGGRDPIFFAQLASETQTFHPDQAEVVQDVCLGCHGILGQRQFKIDRAAGPEDCREPRLLFTRERVDAVPYPSDPAENPHLAGAHFGGLARDGISCTACHHMALTEDEIEAVRSQPQNRCVEERQELLNPTSDGFARTFTGSFWVGDPGELKGPFEEPKQKPMDHAMGILPVFDEAVSSSELCGTCHTVHLPIFDGGKTLGYTYEQTTYPEWAFSAYRTGALPGGGELPYGAGATPQSCQECHMQSSDPATGRFRSKIASIQEYSSFPAADFTLPPEEIDLEARDGFARHTLVGLNLFFVEMAQQFPDVLGIRTQDPMLGPKGLDPVLFTEGAMLEQASNDTAEVTVTDLEMAGDTLTARVTVTNKVGHKLPSGVGFRRAFLELAVLDPGGEVLWASGRTDGAGVIVDERGEPVAGELWWTPDCSERLPGTPHQPHYEEITREDQVQIYQELVTSPAPVPDPECGHHATPGGRLTTSFLSICGHVKDNRLLPAGFLGMDERVQIAAALGDGVLGARPGMALAEDSGPNGVGDDPDYVHGGGDSLVYRADLSGIAGEPANVRATLYYQAIPPFYLQDRFCTAQGPDTDRLYYLAGHLDLEGTRAADWKLEVVGSGLMEIPAAPGSR